MLRQLAKLTRPVHVARGALAVAVYADAAGRSLPAADRGHEGVACVDDAARAVVVLCDLWDATRSPSVAAWTHGLVEFLLYMQDGDGRFVNFITDWDGAQNAAGPTSSFTGGSFWQARGVRALARASLAFDDPRLVRAALRGTAHFREGDVPADVRAIHILAALDLVRGAAAEMKADLAAWCAELVGSRRGGVLHDNPDETEPHLWAHAQEGALALAGAYLDRADLIEVARESALRYLAPIIEGGFDLPTVQPYGVASAVFGVGSLVPVSGGSRPARLRDRARAWFDTRNTAGRPVYDRVAGRVHDGIDAGVLNSHSGAESNIAGAEALLPELPSILATHRNAIERELPLFEAVR